MLCLCGCEEEVNEGRRFVQWHHRRGIRHLINDEIRSKIRLSVIKQQYPDWTIGEINAYCKLKEDLSCQHFCKCGCNNFASRGFNYIRGHHLKNKPSWNSGLTKMTDSRVARYGEIGSNTLKRRYASDELKPWNMGLSRETDERMDRLAKLGSMTIKSQFKNGRKTWNVGLTKELDERVALNGKKHGIAIQGKKQSEAHVIKVFHNTYGKKKFVYVNTDSSRKVFMRSTWEVEYAKFLDKQNIAWEYEDRSFKLSTGKRYFPDFYLLDTNEFHEVKGYCGIEWKTKFNLFKMEYPYIKIILVSKDRDNSNWFCLLGGTV